MQLILALFSILIFTSQPGSIGIPPPPWHWYSLDWSPDGRILATAHGAAIQLWDVQAHKKVKTLADPAGSVMAVAYSPDGKMLASGGYSKQVRLWNTENGELLKTLEGHDDIVTVVAFSPHGQPARHHGTLQCSGAPERQHAVLHGRGFGLFTYVYR